MLHLYTTLLLTFVEIHSASKVKLDFCNRLSCDDKLDETVCGARGETEGLNLRLFKNECELLKYGCRVQRDEAYGIIDIQYCKKAFDLTDKTQMKSTVLNENEENSCLKIRCMNMNISDTYPVCGIKHNGNGYSVRLFSNGCHLKRYNCVHETNFSITDHHICNDVTIGDDIKANIRVSSSKVPNVVIVDANIFNVNNNINDTIDNFFAATHAFDLPVEELSKQVNESERRMLINVFGPQVVFKPGTKKPENVSEDHFHAPTLSSCYHKCPVKCPDTYAPVCGQPGLVAREPSLMFQNHCYMDAAQCKMRWENKSPTAMTSSYIEATFMFCLGDSINTLFRFLPLVRTLQHMGRLKKKGSFRYRVRNMRFFNNMLRREPRLMGR